MCGVVAVAGPNAAGMVDRLEGPTAMDHRGVRSGMRYGSNWAMRHVRLPIVGVGEEHDQPMARSGWIIGFVGELMNFRELHGTRYECDAELAADVWIDNGMAGFRLYDGFWHLVAIEERTGDVYVVADYLAQKPVYVRIGDDYSAVASEPDTLAALSPTIPDRIYLSAVVKWGYCPETRRTPYVGISRVLPGEAWHIPYYGRPESTVVDPVAPILGASPRDLRLAVIRSVTRRIQSSDVPIGCLVSGGVDSSVVYSLAGRNSDVRGYHIPNGEDEYAQEVAPDAVRVDPSLVPLHEAADWMQEPIDLGSLVPQACMSASVRAVGGEVVCLTGDGADELFGGYGRAGRYDSQASDVWQELVAWHLPRLDRIMMRNLIEVRSPFLGREVVRIALGIPWRERTSKGFLKEAFRGLVSDRIVDRPKVPLKTGDVESDREGRSLDLVSRFIKKEWGIPE